MKNLICCLRHFLCLLVIIAGEYRLSAETFTVINTENAGTGTLRQAIINANSHIGPDTIIFNVPESGNLFNGIAWFIQPTSDLPTLTDDGTVIDGTTQSMNRGDKNPDGPEIYITGYQGRNGSPVSVGFTIGSSHNVIRNLIISRFSQVAILLTGSHASMNRIEGNFIGLNFSGNDTLDSPNGTGIKIEQGAEHNTIGGSSAWQRNAISGNRHEGIIISDADSNQIIGNYIGMNATGLWMRQNNGFGIELSNAAGNAIGGSHEGEGNLISGSYVSIYLFQSDSNVIAGNIIGMDYTGTKLMEDAGDGIMIAASRHNRIGGSLLQEGNVICGNGDYAINLAGSKNARDNIIQGNFIGTDITGMKSLGNLDAGIILSNGSSANIIGGTETGEANLISGHAGYGIYIFTAYSDSNQIIGNFIGTDITGNAALPNRNAGICIYNGPKSNQIGPDNIIRFNLHGITMAYETTLYNRITQNSISNNTNSGIIFFESANGGITAPTLIQNTSGVEGTSIPGAVIEIFSDPSTQGNYYEGSTNADGSGYFSWAGTLHGINITATATDASGNTSEFSVPVILTGVRKTGELAPVSFSVEQNIPNPFNAVTLIRFQLMHSSHVTLNVVNTRGEWAASLDYGNFDAGSHEIRFDASILASGIYLYQIRAGEFTAVKKMAVLK